jgi:hypothetical protein
VESVVSFVRPYPAFQVKRTPFFKLPTPNHPPTATKY